MTDKQIKNGIDVSQCECYKEYSNPNEDGDEYNDICECSITESAFCFDECNSNCYYKQLKRKEQECEKAKQNAQDTYELYQALMESFNILQGEKIKLEQECEALGQAYLETNELLQEKTKECTNLKAENDDFKNKIKYMQEYIKTVENSRNEFEKESKFLKEENAKIIKYNILQKKNGKVKNEIQKR